MVRRALIAHRHIRLVADLLAQHRDNARFADACFAREQCDLALAFHRVAPAIHEQRDLMLAPDEGRHAHRACCLEAADVLRLAQHRPHGDGRPKTFQDLRPQRLQLERAAQQSPRRLCDHKASRLGQRLQSRGQIGRLADDGLFLRRAKSDEIADDDDPRRDPDADLQFSFACVSSFATTAKMSRPARHRPLGVFLMRPRETEIGQHPVAHELGDEPVIARDRAGAGVLVGPDDLAHILGIKARRHGGRADEIAEHNGELAALGDVRRRWRGSGVCRLSRCFRRPQTYDSLEQTLAVAHGHAELFEVAVRQVRQHRVVDFVVA